MGLAQSAWYAKRNQKLKWSVSVGRSHESELVHGVLRLCNVLAHMHVPSCVLLTFCKWAHDQYSLHHDTVLPVVYMMLTVTNSYLYSFSLLLFFSAKAHMSALWMEKSIKPKRWIYIMRQAYIVLIAVSTWMLGALWQGLLERDPGFGGGLSHSATLLPLEGKADRNGGQEWRNVWVCPHAVL